MRPSPRLGLLSWCAAALLIGGCALGHSPDLPSGSDDSGFSGDGDGDGFSTSGDNDMGSGGEIGGAGGDCGEGGQGGGVRSDEQAESAEEEGCLR